jgi:hypothetical protein
MDGWPSCCLDANATCPEEKSECDVAIAGDSYCTYAPDKSCYMDGWPSCCLDTNATCPEEKPECDVGIVGDSYCTYSPDKSCFTTGWPSCCDDEDPAACPEEQPPCEVVPEPKSPDKEGSVDEEYGSALKTSMPKKPSYDEEE